MKKYKFFFSMRLNGCCNEEVVEVEENLTESEVEQELIEWVWNQIDSSYTEVTEER